MKYYFKSNYEKCHYSKNWYGNMCYAPNSTILLYNDIKFFCIGYLENKTQFNKLLLNGNIQGYDNEELAFKDIRLNSILDKDIWFGDRLEGRWLEGGIIG